LISFHTTNHSRMVFALGWGAIYGEKEKTSAP
jgi:hypothetical protein